MWEMREVGVAGLQDGLSWGWMNQWAAGCHRLAAGLRGESVLLEGVGVVLRSQVGKHQVHVY